jgi:dihydrofolate reductase
MSNLTLIAAIGQNGELGKQNELIWHLKGDLSFFREQTMGKKVIMGYNTYISLPKLLEGREHIVLTHRDIEFPEGVKVYHDKQALIEELKKLREEVFVIGGGSIYKQFLEYSNQLLLTEIQETCKLADTYFPYFDRTLWNSTIIGEREEKGIRYKHIRYKRRDKE